ncbi:MAG: UDP-3-O-acyl-N-acetylglucosamine deacetylase [Elusimicrobiota bacterium]|jgi:UDP-3-O-[3-hydroxymyristoyl] N-acetylglucosamine deacetylase|nr:UDP-3-O-acyl-N-acetylglucosamine deacetylase [Elusimicrobiota bacterium]
MERKTLQKEVILKGTGLHTGVPCSMTFKPSAQGFISFIRRDLEGSAPIKAELASVSSTMRGTNLKNGAAEARTVEHVLSAANAFGITDLIIDMDGPEPPVMDGSALEYAKAMLGSGFKPLGGCYPVLKLKNKIEYKESDISYSAEPCDKTKITFIFVRGHALVSRQEYTFELTPDNFLKLIAPARTFGFEEEIAFLRANGLAKGGTADNCVIIQKDKFSTPLRFADEMARHKILDLLGDFKLMNAALGPVHISCTGGGHKHNVEFAKILLKELGN